MYSDRANVAARTAACLFYAAAAAQEAEREEELHEKRLWIKEWRKSRIPLESTQKLLKEHKINIMDYRNVLKMDEACFNVILSAIRKDIQKKNTNMRNAIPAEEKLAVTLRFLATGESFMELDSNSKLSVAFLSKAIIETCDAIYKTMKTEYLKFPANKEQWSKIAEGFNTKCQFPHCIGSLDSKHIVFTPNKKDAPLYYNSDGLHSIFLLAVADAYSKFTFIDVGYNGRISDSDALQQSSLMYVLEQPEKYLPPNKFIGNGRLLPHVFVANNAFPLLENMMTPYPSKTTKELEKTYNYRLSRSTNSIKHAFYILTNRFKVLQKKIRLNAEKTKRIVLCCCVLHNFLISNSSWYRQNTFDTNAQKISTDADRMTQTAKRNKNRKSAELIRYSWTEYFNNEGKI